VLSFSIRRKIKMAVSGIHNGWRYDSANSRLDFYFRGTRVGHIDANGMELATGDLEINAGTVNVQDGGAVTQASSKSTAVTLNTNSGQITMDDANLVSAVEVTFTLTNSQIAATDVVVVNWSSVGTAGAYLVGVSAVASGSCTITVTNLTAGSLGEAIVLNFVVIKGASS
jgi:hypothetical protein